MGTTRQSSIDLPVEAATRLASRGWRWRHSWWLLIPIVSIVVLGLTSFIGFGIVALRARTRPLVIAFIVSLAVAVGGFLLVRPAQGNGAIGFLILLCAVGLVVYGVFVNRSWLTWLAQQGSSASVPWWVEAATPIEEVDRRAASALLELDETARSMPLSLDAAPAVARESSTPERLAEIVQLAESSAREAFELKRAADELSPDSPRRRELLGKILALRDRVVDSRAQ